MYSKAEEISNALGQRVVGLLGAQEVDPVKGLRHFRAYGVEILELDRMPIYESPEPSRKYLSLLLAAGFVRPKLLGARLPVVASVIVATAG